MQEPVSNPMTKPMHFSDPHIPKIDPVPVEFDRPFWSVMIPTYNCANYLQETLKSVLAQDPGSPLMQIEVVDDCSTKDDPESVVKALGGERVQFYRQPRNVGAQTNFTTCIQRAKGQWVHILHGDDWVKPGFYDRCRQVAENNPDLGAIFCRHLNVDEQGNFQQDTQGNPQDLPEPERQTPGILENWLERAAIASPVRTPTIVVKRSVYEQLGGFHQELFHTCDREMWIRIAAHYPIWYEPEPLACYREHTASDTTRLRKSAKNISDTRRSIEISKTYLPADRADAIVTQAQDNLANFALELAQIFFDQRELEAAENQIQQAKCCSQSQAVVMQISELYQQIYREWVWQMLQQSKRFKAIFYSYKLVMNRPEDLSSWKWLIKILLLRV